MDETYVPGLNRHSNSKSVSNNASKEVPLFRSKEDTKTPVVGFLYSLSKKGEPEYWPLHVGSNKVGKSKDMNIILSEASISDHHANINIKRLRTKGNALVASVVDMGSKNGIMLNDEELDFEPHSLKNEDVVIFGYNYKCVIVLIDPVRYGLSESEEFVHLNEPDYKENAPLNDTVLTADNGGASDDLFAAFADNETMSIENGPIDLGGGATQIL